MARVVLDANVVVSAAFGGLPLKALVRAFRHEVIVSSFIRKELILLPEELAQKLSPDRVVRLRRYLKVLLYRARTWDVKRIVSVCRDPKDDMYLSLCLSAGARCLITGDQDLLSIPKKNLISVGLDRLMVVNPRRFLSLRI